MLTGRPETTAVWFAASLSVLLAATAMLPSMQLKILGGFSGLLIATVLAPSYVERATPVSAVRTTMVAAVLSMAAVLWLSGASLEAGLAASRAGFIGKPYWWLFSISCWSLGAGLLAAGSLVLRVGYRTRHLSERGYRIASLLPIIAGGGFMIVGALPLGMNAFLNEVHDQAAIFALGSFWLGMMLLATAGSVSRELRRFSAIAAAVIMITWLPTELKRVGLIAASPVKTLYMQAVVFLLSGIWFAWVAREWGRRS